ncbi:hypothetical protein TcasGA2_TC012797 [Tribolium castaneum]|uniref:DUF229 domain containing protein n=1 Tax=Tribolium castaneum TaxID=7070 RepID=D6X0G6_TRICA|nr:PREDICTED: uncharacterized protein LOC659544 [Tribolium castaneum]XP_970935.1 PREDICTED: uncharacterized protein LOC659544 [Tribolium castaneum]EFA10542.1 hypothetical protein TcasGA2_TC012797 [Tribolium castaneum]|eukprot:XP_008198405.1 PREDICTED: uncharacterized protein LOC659544 [Tribolium castaneum]
MLDHSGYKIGVVIAVSVLVFIPILYYNNDFLDRRTIFFTTESDEVYNESKYLVATPKCKIPNLDPFEAEILKFYKPMKYISCSKRDFLTHVTKNDNIATIHINTNAVPSQLREHISCCMASITRSKNKEKPDDSIRISACKDFTDNTTLTHDFIMVKCIDLKTKKQIYENTHAAITQTKQIKAKITSMNTSATSPFSVLFVGIDSISRLNFIRALPQTYQYLEENAWIPLRGYNKMGDNTFPNVMAIMTGFNESKTYRVCNPSSLGQMDKCPMMWFDYQKLNYVTGYAEDEAPISTFNYKKKGFTKPPTDYYFRPYMLGSERLKAVRRDGMAYCTGPETAGERVLNIAKDFSESFKDVASFSFFWTNTFSHNDLNLPSGMDRKIRDFLEDIAAKGVLDNTIIFFLSDHGIRFGEIRYTHTGWLEERLPFIYISVPDRFKRQFPSEFRNLETKRDHLTTPYDIYMTLQHILVLSGLNYTQKPSDGCPKCASLFAQTESERSCEDAAIEPHWCTCGGYNPVPKTNQTVQNAAKFVVGQIEERIRARNGASKCAKFSVGRIITARVSERFSYKSDVYFLVVMETRPRAVFEATVLWKGEAQFELTGGISRLDKYAEHSRCVEEAYLKMFCYCR